MSPRSGWRSSWLLVVLAGCPKPPPEPEVVRYALLRPDAPLRTTPADAPLAPWRNLDATGADAARGYGWTVWRLVATDDGWTRVQSVPKTDPDAFCAAAFEPLEGLVVDLWVPTGTLGTVTTSQQTQVYTDGTGWQISAGLPVVTSPGGQSVVRIGGGLSLLLPQPPAGVGTSFEPIPPLAAVQGPPAAVPPDGIVPLGPDAALGFDRVSEPLVIEEPPNLDGLAVAATRCAKIVAPLTTADGVDRLGWSGREGPPLAIARAGATVYWPVGTVAGQVATERPLDVEVEGTHGHRCFALDLVKWRPEGEEPAPDQTLVICLDPDDVLQEDV